MARSKSKDKKEEEKKKEAEEEKKGGSKKDDAKANQKTDKKRSKSYKPPKPPSYKPAEDPVGHLDSNNLNKRIKAESKVYKKMAAMLEAIVATQKKEASYEKKLQDSINEVSYNVPESLVGDPKVLVFNEVLNLVNRIEEKRGQTVAAHENKSINGIGYLPTNLAAKYNSIKKVNSQKKKAKDEEEVKKIDEENKKLIMELEWQRIRKLKMAYLLYLNHQVDCHHYILTILAKIYAKLEGLDATE